MSQNDDNSQLEIALEQLKRELENMVAENELAPEQVAEIRDAYVGKALTLHANAPHDTDFGPFNNFLMWSEKFAPPRENSLSQDGEQVGGWYVTAPTIQHKEPLQLRLDDASPSRIKREMSRAEAAFKAQILVNNQLKLKFLVEKMMQIHNNLEAIKESHEEQLNESHSIYSDDEEEEEEDVIDDDLSSTVVQEDEEVENLIAIVGDLKHSLDDYFKSRIEKIVSLNDAFRTVCLYGTFLIIRDGMCSVRTNTGYEWIPVSEAEKLHNKKAWWYNPFA